MCEWLYDLDVKIFYLINHGMSSPFWDSFMPAYTDFDPIKKIAILVIVVLLIWRLRLKALWLILLVGLASGLSELTSSHILKNVVGRIRPCHVLENVNMLKGCSSSFSFPSSHATNTFSTFTVLMRFFPKAIPIFLIAGFLLLISRVYVGVHYPSDALVGMVLGVCCGFMALYIGKVMESGWEKAKIEGRVSGDEGYFITYTVIFIILFPVIMVVYGTKILRDKVGRRGFKERFGYINEFSGRPLWVHAASVGEVKTVKGLIEELKERFPDLPVVLSVNTPTGWLEAKKWISDVNLFFFPLDLPWTVKRAIGRVAPRFVILMEAEIWPNFIKRLETIDVPVALINARMSEKSSGRYRMVGRFMKGVLGRLSTIIAQSDDYKLRYVELGYDKDRIKVSGNIKFDISSEVQRLEGDLGGIISTIDRKIMVAGSTHRGEDLEVIKAFLGLKEKIEKLFLIHAPRHLDRVGEVATIIEKLGIPYIKRSEISAGFDPSSVDILLLDTIGELSGVFAFGDLIFMGGSLVKGVGGHNVLEAAAVKKAVLFGPYMGNFPAISKALIDSGGGFEVRDAEEMIEQGYILLTDEKRATGAGEMALKIVEENRGAMALCIDDLIPYLKE